ncbi:MAG: radical SAM protein [Candidatus Eisenbacteria bacterium]
MEISLIAPARRKSGKQGLTGRAFQIPPLSLGVLASLTPPDIDINLLDENMHDLDFSDAPDLVGITCLTASAPRAYEIAQHYRTRGARVVLGGMHPSALPLEAIQHADSVVLGEAEGAWGQVLEDFKAGKMKRFYKGAKPDPSQIFAPRRDIFEHKGYFVKAVVQTSRGCPFGCDFCSVQRFFGTKFRFRSVQSVVEEVRSLASKFVAFVDDNIAGSHPHAKQLFTALAPLNIRWICQAPISIGKDFELLRLMRKAGCRGVFVGFESIVPDCLKEVGKGFNVVDKFKEHIKRIHDHGISVEGAFIFGFDHDDKDCFKRTLDFIVKSKIDFAQFGILTPFPGTKLYQKLNQENRILNHDWEKYDIAHTVFKPAKMTPEELEEGRRWIEDQFYSVGSCAMRLLGLGARVRYLLPFLILNTSYRQYVKAYR